MTEEATEGGFKKENPERITKTEIISSDKDGTLEKVYFEKEARIVKGDDGKQHTKIVEPWEIRAKGRKVQELRGAFKESGPQMFHENWKEWKSIGEETITKPDGSTDVVRADKLDRYRAMPGFCQSATRPTFVVDVPWEGSMKRRGLSYSKTIYRDGAVVTVEER